MVTEVKKPVRAEKVDDLVIAENVARGPVQHVPLAKADVKPVGKSSDWKDQAVQIAAKGVIGAALGVAGGMVLVTAAAAVGGAVLSWSAFASVMGIAGAAGGLSHGVVSKSNKNRK